MGWTPLLKISRHKISEPLNTQRIPSDPGFRHDRQGRVCFPESTGGMHCMLEEIMTNQEREGVFKLQKMCLDMAKELKSENGGDFWVAEWSESQQCFNLETLEKSVKDNLRAFQEASKCNDWVIVGVFRDIHDAGDHCHKLRMDRGIEPVMDKFAREHP